MRINKPTVMCASVNFYFYAIQRRPRISTKLNMFIKHILIVAAVFRNILFQLFERERFCARILFLTYTSLIADAQKNSSLTQSETCK